MQNKNYVFKYIPLSVYACLVCALGALFYCYEYFLRISPSVMARELMGDYHLCAAQFGYLVASYYYIYTPMQLFVGLLMDRYGPRRLLTLACFCCALGAYLFADNILLLAYVGRFLIGFGSAFAFVGALKLAATWLPPSQFGLASGATTCLGMVGAMAGDATLGHMVHGFGWRNTIYISAIAGAVLMTLLYLFVRDQNPVQANRYSKLQCHSQPATMKDLFTGMLLAIKNLNIWYAGIIGFCMYVGVSTFAELWGISYLRSTYSLDSIQAGRLIFMIFLGWAIGGPLMGIISDRLRRRKLIIVCGSILSLIITCLILYVPIWSIKEIRLLFLFMGIFNSAQVLIFVVAREVCSKEVTGIAIALANMLTMLGGMIFQPLIGKILDLCWNGAMANGVRFFSAYDYRIAFAILPISLFIAVILSLMLKESYPYSTLKRVKKVKT